MSKVLSVISIVSLLFCISSSLSAATEELSSSQIKQYKSGIFEVVTAKLTDKTTYKDEFPTI